MDMFLEDTLVALGLEDEGTASTRTGGEWGGNSFAVPIGWSGGYMGDFRPTPGHTPVASGTPGGYSDSIAGRGATLVLQIEGLGLPAAILAPRLGGVRGLVGLLRMSGASAARNMAHPPTRALLRHPLGNLQQVSPAHL